MIEARPGVYLEAETRAMSEALVDKNQYYAWIIQDLKDHKDKALSAREIAKHLKEKQLVLSDERQTTAPRLTELKRMWIVEAAGKEMDVITGRPVTMYRLREHLYERA